MTNYRRFIISLHLTILIVFVLNPINLLAISDQPPGGMNPGSVLYIFVVLIIIIVLIIILIRFLAQKNRSWMANRAIRSLSGLHLGQNKSIQVVEIGHSLYVIGIGDNVELLEKIEHADEIKFIKDSLIPSSSLLGEGKIALISDAINKIKNRFMGRSNNKLDEETPVSFQEVFNNKMNQISSRKRRVEELLAEEKNKERSKEQ